MTPTGARVALVGLSLIAAVALLAAVALAAGIAVRDGSGESVSVQPTHVGPVPASTSPPTGSTPTPTGAPIEPPAPAPPAAVPDGAQQVRVVEVVDGDTLTVAALAAGSVLPGTDPLRVRLLQIDTPERGARYSAEATAMLASVAAPGAVLWALRDLEPQDRYGRELLYLWTGDGRFVNEEMVRSGLATAVLYEPNDRYIDVMRAAEAEARGAGLGIWSSPAPGP